MKTVLKLVQDYFAWLSAIAGSQAFAALENPGCLPSSRVVADSPRFWLPAGTQLGFKGLNPEGWTGPWREGFLSVKLMFPLQDSFANQAKQV